MDSIDAAFERNADLIEKLTQWLGETAERPKAQLRLSRADARKVLAAAEAQLAHMREIILESRARIAALDAKSSERDEVYASTRLGFDRWGRRRPAGKSKHDERAIVETYVAALEGRLSGVSRPHNRLRFLARDRRPGTYQLSEKVTPAEALRATMWAFNFRSREACRAYLRLARARIRKDRRGWRSAINSDFVIPGYKDAKGQKPSDVPRLVATRFTKMTHGRSSKGTCDATCSTSKDSTTDA